jgi:hypothetical protein
MGGATCWDEPLWTRRKSIKGRRSATYSPVGTLCAKRKIGGCVSMTSCQAGSSVAARARRGGLCNPWQ